MCSFHYRIADPTQPDDYLLAVQLVNALITPGAANWMAKLRGMLSDDAYVSSVRVRRVGPVGGNEAAVVFTTTDNVGSLSSPIHAQQIAGCLIWISETTPGRTARNFIPAVPVVALDSSRWSVPYKGLADIFIATHTVGFSVAAGIFLPVIYDRIVKTGPVVDGGYLSPLVGTQRKREIPV